MDLLSRIPAHLVLKFTLVIAAFAWYKLAQHYKNSRAKSWQPAGGFIFKVESTYKDSLWTAHLYYSYSWEGEYYSGTTVRQFATERGLDAFTEKFPKDLAVMVRVNVAHPEESALILDEQFVRV